MSQILPSKAYRKTKRVIEKVSQEWGIAAIKEPSKVVIQFNNEKKLKLMFLGILNVLCLIRTCLRNKVFYVFVLHSVLNFHIIKMAILTENFEILTFSVCLPVMQV
jgi:hypothetical protein